MVRPQIYHQKLHDCGVSLFLHFNDILDQSEEAPVVFSLQQDKSAEGHPMEPENHKLWERETERECMSSAPCWHTTTLDALGDESDLISTHHSPLNK